MRFRARNWICGLSLAAAAIFVMTQLPAKDDPKTDDPAVARTRKQVKMLDDLYKTAIVLITKTYVKDAGDTSAAVTAKALFAAMKEKGHHDVRLVDATGKPISKENIPADDFEKDAIRQLLAGKEFVEQVVEGKDGKRTFRAATPVPVVLEACIMCHPHYKDVKKGQPIGALAYKLTVE